MINYKKKLSIPKMYRLSRLAQVPARNFVTFVEQNKRVIISTFGKASPNNVHGPGFVVRIPFIQQFHRVSLETRSMKIEVKALTKDRVNVDIVGDIRFQVVPTNQGIFASIYSMQNPLYQILSTVDSAIRQFCANEELQQIFGDNANLRLKAIESAISYKERGFDVIDVIIGTITPPKKIVEQQEEVQASQLRAISAENDVKAAITRAEGAARVKIIEGEASGKAISASRGAMLNGLGLAEMPPEKVAELLLQYAKLETQQKMAESLGGVKGRLTIVGNGAFSKVIDGISNDVMRGST